MGVHNGRIAATNWTISATTVTSVKLAFYMSAVVATYIIFTAPAMGSLDYMIGYVMLSTILVALTLYEIDRNL